MSTPSTQTPAPGSNPPPDGRPARPSDLTGSKSKSKFDVYVVGAAKDVLRVGMGVPDVAEVLVPVAKGIEAATREDACWAYSEGEGKTDALSDDPPRLVALPQGRYGVPEPKTYPLTPTVVRGR